MDATKWATIITLAFSYNWTPMMIAQHTRVPVDEVMDVMNEYVAGQRAAADARRLRHLAFAGGTCTVRVPATGRALQLTADT